MVLIHWSMMKKELSIFYWKKNSIFSVVSEFYNIVSKFFKPKPKMVSNFT